LFRCALAVGKRVRRETAIGRGAVSFSSVAVELVREALPGVAVPTAMVIGAGRMAQATAVALIGSGVRVTTVANRSIVAAEELAERINARGVTLDAICDELDGADILICSTDSPRPILRAADLRAAVRRQEDRPLVVIDMAVPRDVEPAVRGLPGVILADIDDLERVVQANLEGRRQEADHAARIVEQEVRQYCGREDSARRGSGRASTRGVAAALLRRVGGVSRAAG
jgi:glutamyl-tRNA reductase